MRVERSHAKLGGHVVGVIALIGRNQLENAAGKPQTLFSENPIGSSLFKWLRSKLLLSARRSPGLGAQLTFNFFSRRFRNTGS